MAAPLGDTRWDDGDVLLRPEGQGQTAGALLRAQRERLGWTLPVIAGHLRIRQPFLEAIEEGRIDDLPGRAYAIGFIRTYAQSLGLDPAEVAGRFRAEAGEPARKTELEFPAPVPDRGVPALAVVLVGAVLAIGAYAAWYRMSGNERPRPDAVQPVPDRLAALVPDHPPAPAEPPVSPARTGPSLSAVAPSPPVSAVAPEAATPNPSAAAAAVPAPAAPGAAVPTNAGSAQEMQTAALEPPGSSAGSTAPSGSAPAPLATGQAEPSHVELRATADAWMRVREKGGHEYLDRVLKSGETWPVPGKPNLLLSTGNAGGTEVLVDGVAMPSLGGDGVVRHDLPLDPDALRARLAGAQPTGAQPVAKPLVSPHNQ